MKLSERFGKHPGVILWHISNEYGGNFRDASCHCEECQKAFRKWLKKKYKTLDNLAGASFEELQEMNDVGEVMANSIVEFFAQDQTRDLIEKLKQAGVNTEVIEEETGDNRFEGKTFVLTGSLEEFTRKEAEELIEKYGGKTSGSVSKKTDYVLAGEEAGSKLKKAQELGVTIITEQEFKEMVKE